MYNSYVFWYNKLDYRYNGGKKYGVFDTVRGVFLYTYKTQ